MKQIAWLMLVVSIAIAEAGEPSDKKMNTTNTTELATFGGGCFWCMEAVFERLDGVESVTSGYAGGKKDKPTYEEVRITFATTRTRLIALLSSARNWKS